MVKRQLPTFASEAAEAQWHAEHQDELDTYLEAPSAEQIAKATAILDRARRTPSDKLAALAKGQRSEAISLRVSVADLEAAKALASRKGIGYQTLLKMAIHEWLERQQA